MRTQEGVRAEARTMELRAVAQLGRAAARSPTPPCRSPRRPRSTLRAAVWPQQLRRRPSEPATGVRHRAVAPRLREPYPVYARAPCAHAVWTAPKPVL
jgi:hypothetical protein